MINPAENAGISMLRWIPTLPDIFLPRKYLVGYVPRFVSNANYSGFEAYASAGLVQLVEPAPNSVSTIQPGVKAFKGDGSEFQWQANRDMPPYCMSISCPTHARIWKVGLRSRNRTTDRLYDWNIEGLNKGDVFHKIPESDLFYPTDGSWDIFYTSPNNLFTTRVYIDNEYKEFLIDSVVKYRFFRLVCNRSESNRPGISTVQLLVYDD